LFLERVDHGGVKDTLTLPVAPQHASRASNITILRSLPSSFSRRKRAADAPEIPLPMITRSAFVGSNGVVRWPKRTLEGSLCQYDLVELGVGRLAWPGILAPVMVWYFMLLTSRCCGRLQRSWSQDIKVGWGLARDRLCRSQDVFRWTGRRMR